MAGTVNQELGLLFQGPNYVIVKKGGKAGEKVEKHNHPEANVIFTVVFVQSFFRYLKSLCKFLFC